MADENRLKTLHAFLQQQGFIWGPSPEIYGGLAGFYTYGPNGAALKRNVEGRIRAVFAKNQFFEVETPTILPKEVWEASGHLAGFTDPLVTDKKGNIWRADNLVEDHFSEKGIDEPIPVKPKELLEAIEKHAITAPDGTPLLDEITDHNLMMQTTVGTDIEAYNRPETATATYLPFTRYAHFFRKKLPFAVFQIGKAYRNEISPRQHLMRLREFTQAEAQLFIHPEKKNDGYDMGSEETKLPLLSWKQQEAGKGAQQLTLSQARKQHLSSDAYAYTAKLAYELFRSLGVPEDRIRLREHGPDEKAFYATDAWDIEIDLPTFGWKEVCGVHDRGTYDLNQHAKASGQDMTVYDEETKKHITPNVIEIAFGIDRSIFALLDIFYDEKDEEEGKTRLALPYKLAPVEVTVLPLSKKLSEKAQAVFETIREAGFITTYDESGSIGKRYLRATTIGTPYCLTIDFDTLEDGAVTVRDRDTEEQERVSIEQLVEHLSGKLR